MDAAPDLELERYRQPAYGTALSLLGDHHLAEDAVQDAFAEALRSWTGLREPAKLGAWVRTIVRRRCFRLLRRRDRGMLPLPEVPSLEEPWQTASGREERRDVLTRVRSLPRPLREVVVLHYLRGCPHKEVAAFLDLPPSTVNDRLHQARRLLKGRPMRDLTPEIGTVVRVEGALAEVRFEAEAQPDVFDALTPADDSFTLRVIGTLDEDRVRCLRLAGETPSLGQRVMNRTAAGGTWMAAVASDETLREAAAALGRPREGFVATGIKPIDLFCPLPASGSVGLFGTSGTGKMVLVQELAHRLGGKGPRLFYLADRSEPALIRDLRAAGETLDPDVVWLTSRRVTDPEFAAANDLFDASIFCSPLLGIRGLWPAVDPLRSRSAVETDERHARLAKEARTLLGEARETTRDPVLLEYLACRAYGAARRRLAQATPPRTTRERRARLLEAFLTTPFHVAEEANGIPGVEVALADTLYGVEAILAGACDDRAPDDLHFVGVLPAPAG